MLSLLQNASNRQENYCRGTIAEGNYDSSKATLLLIDKGAFCTYLLQVDDEGFARAVFSTPNSIGRVGHETKAGHYKVGRLVRYPTWVNPLSGATVRPYNQTTENPLGVAAITLIPLVSSSSAGSGSSGAEINMAVHGTNHEELVGRRRVSGGCIRHFNFAIRLMLLVLLPEDRVVIVDNLQSRIALPPQLQNSK